MSDTCSECGAGLPIRQKDLDRVVRERDGLKLQLSEERERYAKIADAFGVKAGNDEAGSMAHVIAQAIRSSVIEKRKCELCDGEEKLYGTDWLCPKCNGMCG